MVLVRVVIAMLFAALLVGHDTAYCQKQGIYSTEIVEFSTSVRSLLARAEQLKNNNQAGKLVWREENLLLSEKMARVEQEAMKSDLELMRTGQGNSKRLILVAQICKALYLTTALTDSFVVTNDKLFWNAALKANDIAKSLAKGL